MNTIEQLNEMTLEGAHAWFMQTCTATQWCELMTQSRPYTSVEHLSDCAAQHWAKMQSSDYREAFEGHPMIGDIDSLREKYATTKKMAGNEQAGTAVASESVLKALQQANADYLEKHGFIFIICASGLSAETMLAALNDRIENSTHIEEQNAAREQLKITLLRISKAFEGNLLTRTQIKDQNKHQNKGTPL
ncbi:2-oxo-4-hydroxy-4-carboxy-5-ureidoimidazoline decarboxylase [Glaciecola sp. KUL10]|uniref:2-oxo-4-hydroxy-4-carboxy-5-ureidoimidazoline decarboxylase n=1 Tax=Glaciecola sp. (strain KUL10) TaxID=2161813 RepID=UPI000D7827A8|nr:2-oxo-4-hydroxy-4-carboxy-5-ureidoimidazoline decarboxylase [Glaciecola sp. KUL10]GBL05240.1 OHCU decarboxylase [Glaciecola sp. KUL10]